MWSKCITLHKSSQKLVHQSVEWCKRTWPHNWSTDPETNHFRKTSFRNFVTDHTDLRRIYGPKSEEVTGGWRIHNEELHNLYSSPNVIKGTLNVKLSLYLTMHHATKTYWEVEV
jgi:hypothetical protein